VDPRHRRRLGALLLATLGMGCGSETSPAPASAEVEPDVKLVSFEELVAELAARRGKGLLINHWATW
jgi:hypothetical protein